MKQVYASEMMTLHTQNIQPLADTAPCCVAAVKHMKGALVVNQVLKLMAGKFPKEIFYSLFLSNGCWFMWIYFLL
jgi:hypothetical protein